MWYTEITSAINSFFSVFVLVALRNMSVQFTQWLMMALYEGSFIVSTLLALRRSSSSSRNTFRSNPSGKLIAVVVLFVALIIANYLPMSVDCVVAKVVLVYLQANTFIASSIFTWSSSTID